MSFTHPDDLDHNQCNVCENKLETGTPYIELIVDPEDNLKYRFCMTCFSKMQFREVVRHKKQKKDIHVL